MAIVIVDTETCLSLQSWTGVENTFNAGFKAEAASDVDVYSRDAAGVDTLLTQGTHYTVTLGTDGAVTIVRVSFPPAPRTIVIVRDTSALQGVDFASLGSFAPSVHTTLHSRAAMRDAEDKRERARSLRAPYGDTLANIPPVATRKNLVLGFDNTGQPIAVTAGGGPPGGGVTDGDKGDITVSGGGVTWTIDADAVDNSKLRNSGALSVIGRSTNSIGDPADIAATAASGAVLRESGSVLGFGQVATAGHADNSITYVKLQDVTASPRLIGRGTAGAGDPEEITLGTGLTMTGTTLSAATGGVTDGDKGDITVSGGGVTWTIDANAVDNTKLRDGGALSVIGRSANSSGDPADIAATAASGAVLRESANVLGFGQVATAGIANDAIDNTKLRNSQPLSVIGNATNAAADPADIAAGVDGDVLRRAGTTVGFGAIATAGISDNAVSNIKLRDSAALSVIGNATNATGDPADILAGTDGDVLRRSGTTLGFGPIGAANISNNAIDNTKLRDSGALSVIGRSVNSAGDPGDIAATSASNAVLREDGAGVLSFGTVATAGIADDAITNVKLRNSNGLAVIGRAAGTTGDPGDIIATASTDAVLRESGGALGWGTVATNGIAANAVTNAKLATATNQTLKSNISGGSATPADNTLTAILDNILSSSRGTIIYRGVAAWSALAPGTAGNFLQTAGAGADPSWQAAPGSSGGIPEAPIDGLAYIRKNAGWVDGATLFQALDGDLTAIAALAGTNTIYYRSAANTWSAVTIGSGLSFSGGTLANTGSAPTGQALTKTDDTNVTLSLGGTPATALLQATSITVGWNGRLGLDRFTQGSDGQVLIGKTSLDPAWATMGGDATISNAGSMTIAANAVSDLKLRDSAALSVIGRSVNSIGDPGDIATSSASNAVLRENGAGVLAFGQVATAGIANAAVTFAKLQTIGTDRLLGRDTAATGSPEEISLSADLEFTGAQAIRIVAWSGGDITKTAGGTSGTINNNAVTYAKMQDVTATARFIGRITAGAGDPEELTGTQATSLLDQFSTATTTKGVVPGSNGASTANFLRADGTWAAPSVGGIADDDYGDITISGGVWTIDAGAVSYSKIQNVSATDRVLGRQTAGAGSIEEITCTAAGRALIDDADAAAQRTTLGLAAGATAGLATTSEIWAGTASTLLTPLNVLNALAGVGLTDQATISVDLALGVFFTVTLAGNRTLGNPTNPKVGRTIYLRVAQDATGNRTLSYGANYDFGQDTAPTLSTGASAQDLLAFFVSTTTKIVFLGIRTGIG
jgi:hypothetical protein